MNIDDDRLLTAIAGSIERVTTRYDVPGSDMDFLAVMTVMGELQRGRGSERMRELYVVGHERGLRLAEVLGADGFAGSVVTQLKAMPANIDDVDDASAPECLAELRKVLSSLVANSGFPQSPQAGLQDAVYSLCSWEGELVKLPSAATFEAQHGYDPKEMLETSAREQGGALEGAEVVELNVLTGGFANETILFKLALKDGQVWDLVARVDNRLPLGIAGRDIGGEFHLIKYLHKAGLAVAEPIWLESDVERYGGKFLVTRKVEGSNFGTVVEASRLSSSQLKALASELARIHLLALDKTDVSLRESPIDDGLIGVSMTEAVSAYVERWISLWHSTKREDSPTVEATLSWLRANIPNVEDVPVLVHGDYGVHNILINGDEIGGVVDWEMAHIGDPAEDITWLLSSFKDPAEAEEFWRYYAEAGGKPTSDFQIEFYRVFGHFKLLVIALEAQLRFNTLPGNHPPMLVLGSMFIQGPALQMSSAIQKADEARTLA